MTMDYKYIEQLLDRYFECETSLDEEQILRAFFAQENVPVSLLQYRELFTEVAVAKKEETLSGDFDSRILAAIGEMEAEKPLHVKARVIKMRWHLRPLYKAAACVAIVLALGQAAQMPYADKAEKESPMAKTLDRPKVYKDHNTVAKGDSLNNSSASEDVAIKTYGTMAN